MKNDFWNFFFHSFFNNKIYLLILSIVTIVIVFHQIISIKKPLIIFPSHGNFAIIPYTDKNENGNSIITNCQIDDSLISINFILKKGFIRPFVGITFIVPYKNQIDLTNYNQLEFKICGKKLNNINVHLVTENDNLLEVYGTTNVEIDSTIKTYRINLKDFKIPEWWYDNNNFSPHSKIKPNLKKVKEVNFATGLMPETDLERGFQIFSIKVSQNRNQSIIISAGIWLAVFITLLLYKLVRHIILYNKNIVVINYKPIEVENINKHQQYLKYISENFSNPNLTLHEISKETGLSSRKISDEISKEFKCNVKTYINKIRITEAQRLLKQTNLTISEIAYKVGFNSPTHFNRVFKSITGKNPRHFSKNNNYKPAK